MNHKNKKILILDADGSAGLASLQSLGSAGCEIHAAVRSRGSLSEVSRWCVVVYDQPKNIAPDKISAWIVDLDKRFDFSLIIPSTETSLRWVRLLPQDHPTRKKACISSDVSIDLALNKDETYALASSLGIPVAPSRLLKSGMSVPEGIVFPSVLKPVCSKVQFGQQMVPMTVAVVRTPSERHTSLAAMLPFTDVQEQPWIKGRGIGVEVLYDRGRMVLYFVHERLHEWPLTGGASTLRRAAEDDSQIVELSKNLLDALSWHGVAMIEWRRSSEGQFFLVEINPRLWGSLPLTIAAGVDVPLGLLSLAFGQPVTPQRPWRIGLTARKVTNDFHWCIENARANHEDTLLLTEPVWHSISGWFHIFMGREVWDGWHLNDPKVAIVETTRLVRKRVGSIANHVLRLFLFLPIIHRHKKIMKDARLGLGRPIQRILFVCYGNICRSPFAAIVAHQHLPTIEVESAGFFNQENRSSPAQLVEISRGLGVDLSNASSKRLTAKQVMAADLIIVMDMVNMQRLTKEFPEAIQRTTLLGLFFPAGPIEISDPYSLTPIKMMTVMNDVMQATTQLCNWLVSIVMI